MTETNNAPVPPENAPDPARQETELRAELARVRGRNTTLKIVAAILVSMFLIIAGGGFYIYHKLSAARDTVEDAFQAFPQHLPSGYQPENRTLPMGQGVYSSTSMPASSLGLFTGGLPGGSPAGAMSPDESEKILKAMSKYADRSIVKAFMADLRRNPDMAEAFAASKGNNPIKVIGLIQNAKGMDKIVMKYAARPEFLKLMMEVMNDPEMGPLLKNMPAGVGMPAGMGVPSNMPQGVAVSIPAGPQTGVFQSADQDGDGEMTFDPSVISGPDKTAPVASKKAPPPIDSAR